MYQTSPSTFVTNQTTSLNPISQSYTITYDPAPQSSASNVRTTPKFSVLTNDTIAATFEHPIPQSTAAFNNQISQSYVTTRHVDVPQPSPTNQTTFSQSGSSNQAHSNQMDVVHQVISNAINYQSSQPIMIDYDSIPLTSTYNTSQVVPPHPSSELVHPPNRPSAPLTPFPTSTFQPTLTIKAPLPDKHHPVTQPPLPPPSSTQAITSGANKLSSRKRNFHNSSQFDHSLAYKRHSQLMQTSGFPIAQIAPLHNHHPPPLPPQQPLGTTVSTHMSNSQSFGVLSCRTQATSPLEPHIPVRNTLT